MTHDYRRSPAVTTVSRVIVRTGQGSSLARCDTIVLCTEQSSGHLVQTLPLDCYV